MGVFTQMLARALGRRAKQFFLIAIPMALSIGLAQAASTGPLTLADAIRQAESANPTLRQAQAALYGAQGEQAVARAPLYNNPVVSSQVDRRRFAEGVGEPEANATEWNVGVSQAFELPGKQQARRDAAEKNLSYTEQNILATRAQVQLDVEQAFIRVLSLQQRVPVEEQNVALLQEAANATRKLVDAGQEPVLPGNVAQVELERARNQLSQVREQLVQARTDLAAQLQLPPDRLPQVTGSLKPRPLPYTLAQLLTSASQRPSVQALAYREGVARSRLAFERASARPDITVGLTTGREGRTVARENFTGISVSVPLPLFNRNQAGIGRASTELAQAQIERQAAERNVPAQVTALWQRLQQSRERVQRLDNTVLPLLQKNRRLARISRAAGQMDLLQLIIVNRQVADAQRDLLDAWSDLEQTQANLEAAAGWAGAMAER